MSHIEPLGGKPNAIHAFLNQYIDAHPVNATFTGIQSVDGLLPDWSREGREAEAAARADVRRALSADFPATPELYDLRGRTEVLDAYLAHANLDVRDAEYTSRRFVELNPALWTGEAIFGPVAHMLRPGVFDDFRLPSLRDRLAAVPRFLAEMPRTVQSHVPSRWVARAHRECGVAQGLFTDGLAKWLRTQPADDAMHAEIIAAGRQACAAFAESEQWLGSMQSPATDDYAAGDELFGVLLSRGHLATTSAGELLQRAKDQLSPARDQLARLGREVAGSWPEAEAALARDVPPPNEYFAALELCLKACEAFAVELHLVDWPRLPLRFVPFPDWARDYAPKLYWLFYRSPAPLTISFMQEPHDYFVAPGWNRSTIKLNHVVHHGGLGHHVQNCHSQRSMVGQMAAADCASRIGMFLGGSLAEGWACYATELADELGFLKPLERAAQQHTRVRLLARAIVDISLHARGMTFDDGVAFYVNEVGMSRDAAESEVTKNSMFPCTALMYWLGTQGILELREEMRRSSGNDFNLKSFHDEILGRGAIPVPLIARLMGGSGW